MPNHVIVWDIETVPDLQGYAAANGHDGKTDEEIREAMGDKFPKHIFHQIICIGAFIAHRDNGCCRLMLLELHTSVSDREGVITGFVNRIAELNLPQRLILRFTG